jgi:6-phosphofructokinase
MTAPEKPGLAIMTSGGDSAGMNPAVKCAPDYAAQRGYAPFLVYDGLKGLIADRIFPASSERLSGIMYKGCTVLRSLRSPEFYDFEAGETNSIMVYRDGTYGCIPIAEVTHSKYRMDPALLQLAAPPAC